MDKNNLKYRELAKVCLIAILKLEKEITNFTNKMNELECLFEINFEQRIDKIPIEEIGKVLEITGDVEDDEISDKLYRIAYNEENNKSIEDGVEKFLKEYGV